MRKAILALSLALIACISAQAQIVQLGNTANTSAIEDYASLELQRYYYQLSGELLTIAKQNEISADTRFSEKQRVIMPNNVMSANCRNDRDIQFFGNPDKVIDNPCQT